MWEERMRHRDGRRIAIWTGAGAPPEWASNPDAWFNEQRCCICGALPYKAYAMAGFGDSWRLEIVHNKALHLKRPGDSMQQKRDLGPVRKAFGYDND